MQTHDILGKRWRVGRLSNTGGFGAIYEVADVTTGRQAIAKVLHDTVANIPNARAKFAQEARLLQTIDSPFVVRLIDAGIDEQSDTPWLVMETVPGVSLSKFLSSAGGQPPERVLKWMRQVAAGLDAAHRLTIVHRDITPSNIMIAVGAEGMDDRITLIDFGISTVLDGASKKTTHAVAGTELYMAPELRKGVARLEGDVYSLGLLVYECLVGAPYWRNREEIYVSALQGADAARLAVARAAVAGVTLAPTFDVWFDRCTHAEPTARFASAPDAVDALVATLSESKEARLGAGVALQLAVTERAGGPADPTMERTQLARRTGEGPGLGFDATDPAPPVRARREASRRSALGVIGGVLVAVLLASVGIGSVLRRRSLQTPRLPMTSASAAAPSVEDVGRPALPVPTAPVLSLGSVSADPAGDPCAADQALVPAGTWTSKGTTPTPIAVARFCLDRHEATVADYRSCVLKGECTARRDANWLGMSDNYRDRLSPLCSARLARGDDYPITCVSHTDAEVYCAARARRLPSADEWEWSAKGAVATSDFPWGRGTPMPFDPAPKLCWSPPGVAPQLATCEVSAFPAGRALGAIDDLQGNVREWTSTRAPSSDFGVKFVAKGSQYETKNTRDVMADIDTPIEQETRSPNLGFRCAADVRPASTRP